DGVDFGELALRRFSVEPGEEAHERRAIAQVRRSRTRNLGFVLDRLHARDGIGALVDLAARALDDFGQNLRRGALIEADGFAFGDLCQGFFKGRWLAHVGKLCERVAHFVRELAAVDEQKRLTVVWYNRP